MAPTHTASNPSISAGIILGSICAFIILGIFVSTIVGICIKRNRAPKTPDQRSWVQRLHLRGYRDPADEPDPFRFVKPAPNRSVRPGRATSPLVGTPAGGARSEANRPVRSDSDIYRVPTAGSGDAVPPPYEAPSVPCYEPAPLTEPDVPALAHVHELQGRN